MQKNKNSNRMKNKNESLKDIVSRSNTYLEISEELAENQKMSKKLQKQAPVPYFKEAPPYDTEK